MIRGCMVRRPGNVCAAKLVFNCHKEQERATYYYYYYYYRGGRRHGPPWRDRRESNPDARGA